MCGYWSVGAARQGRAAAGTLMSIILFSPGIGRTRDDTLVLSELTVTSHPSELPASVSSASWQICPRFSNRKSCPPGPVSSLRRRAVRCSRLGRPIDSSAVGRCARSQSRCSHASIYLACQHVGRAGRGRSTQRLKASAGIPVGRCRQGSVAVHC